MKVIPSSSRDEVVGVLGGALKIKVAAPPEDGKANRAVCELLARTLQISSKQVTVVSGAASPRKRIAITGITSEYAKARLDSIFQSRR